MAAASFSFVRRRVTDLSRNDGLFRLIPGETARIHRHFCTAGANDGP
jgi:hypothetical protein